MVELRSGMEFLRSIRPEAIVTLDGQPYQVGGLVGLRDHGYLDAAWLSDLKPDVTGFQYVRHRVERPSASLPWAPKYGAPDTPWPPKGIRLLLDFEAPKSMEADIRITVAYELYDGLPCFDKRVTIANYSDHPVTVGALTCEQLAVTPDQAPRLLVESDYSFHNTVTTRWENDPQYVTAAFGSQQEYYHRDALRHIATKGLDDLWHHEDNGHQTGMGDHRTLMSSRYPLGPAKTLAPGEKWSSFRTLELLHDSDDRERQGLARRRMYRKLAPWVQENPVFMHLRASDSDSIRRAVDQCAAVGFEMIILTFWSGFDMLTEDPKEVARYKADFAYAHQRGIKIGGYILFCSTASYGSEHDAVQQVYPPSLCLGSAHSDAYFERLWRFMTETEMDVIETDGPYHGYPCHSTEHKYHTGYEDSIRVNWERQREFFQECRRRGIYVNAPDWYFLSGSNKTGMGYREENWSLPRELQVVIARQNIYDGTWEKTPSMGWMMLPLVEYHGGGPAATLEPLEEHLDAYEAHLAQNFGSGVVACYRGPRLYDTDVTKLVVHRWVAFYKRYRDILNSDIIHVRRPDGRDYDCMMHVNPDLETKALAMVYNPLSEVITRSVRLPLYYTGLSDKAIVRIEDGDAACYALDRDRCIEVIVQIPARGWTWLTVE
jgi:hypothetical protein